MKTKATKVGRKMRFRTVKLGFSELSYGGDRGTIEEVLSEIYTHHGWDSLDELKESVRRWSEVAEPGNVFCTRSVAIIATH